MSKRIGKKSAASEEERFLLQSLHRLPHPDQRYLFTLLVDLISIGLASTRSRSKGSAKS